MMISQSVKKQKRRLATLPLPSLVALAVILVSMALLLPLGSVAFISARHTSSDIQRGLETFFSPKPLPTANDRLLEFAQRGSVDCGAASLAYVLNFFGLEIKQEVLEKGIAMTEEGTSMAELARFAQDSGFKAWGERQNLKRLEGVTKPVIAFIGKNHFVVVVRADKRWVTYFDPAAADVLRKLPSEDFRQIWRGEVLRVLPQQLTFSWKGFYEDPSL